jgi:hypothetical protein
MRTDEAPSQTRRVNDGPAEPPPEVSASLEAAGPGLEGQLAAEAVRGRRPAMVPVAVFIMVEIMLAADTISVIFLGELDPRNPGTAPVAMLLCTALLANLGLVCGLAAASLAGSRFAAASAGNERYESASGRHRRRAVDTQGPAVPGSRTPAMPAGG